MNEELKLKTLALDEELKQSIMSEVSKFSWKDSEGNKHINIETVEYILEKAKRNEDYINN